MLVSILLPTRNRLPYLRASLASALAQQDADIEVLVSDDGSADGTVDYVTTVAAQDQRVRLLTDNPSPGIFENVEHLIAAARGDAFTILGDDDLLDPAFCRRLSEPLAADPSVVLSFCDHRTIDDKGRVLRHATLEASRTYGRSALPGGVLENPELVALRGGIWLGFALYRQSVFRAERFDASCGTAADWDYAIRAAHLGKLSYVPTMLGSYRDHRGTASRRIQNRSEQAIRVLSKHVMRDPDAERTRREMLRDQAKRNAYHQAAFDRSAARNSLELYDSLGGSGAAAHVVAARVILRLPSPAGAWMHAVVSFVTSAGRTIKRALSRL
jgi:glycosyltransferase involved in cell wall biosynthesis